MTRRLAPRRQRIVGFWLLVGAVVALVTTVAGFTVRSGAQSASAEREASVSSPALPTTTPIRTISIVADEATLQPQQSGAATDWPQIVARALDAQVFVIDTGDGYVQTAVKGDPTFVNHAGEVAPRADVVVFVGGRNDVDSPQARLLTAAYSAYASAAETAPKAKVVVVGPVVAPPADLDVLAVRNTLWYAVARTHAEFVDPIGGKWLKSSSFDSNGGLTSAGKKAFASHMEQVIRAALAGDH